MASSRRVTVRLFAASALLSVVPIIVLGFVLSASYRAEAKRRGMAQARSEAEIIGQTAIEPFLPPEPLITRLRNSPDSPYATLRRMSAEAMAQHHVLRLRIRNLTGTIIFTGEGTGFGDPPEDDALEAAEGEVVVELTHLDS